MDTWVEKQLDVFTSGQYGANYDATKIIMENFEEYKTQLELQKVVSHRG